jgi:hypothetical protein
MSQITLCTNSSIAKELNIHPSTLRTRLLPHAEYLEREDGGYTKRGKEAACLISRMKRK